MVSRCTRREIDIQVIFLKHPLRNIMLPSRDFPTAENLSEVPVGNMYPVFMFVWGIDFLYPIKMEQIPTSHHTPTGVWCLSVG